ncbi:MAG TPA: Asp-tRNA(Asn)/Glu-tRNA(Gln) amidotransferase subunit GatB [Tepidisphaeraceae bacterium]|jgi:aspartyl-tRNA(Asn)/glutamyl-tRNA(Gln) amidotransferase subunit B
MPTRKIQSIKVLIGMEIHVQLATASKMFTGAKNGFGGEPNSQVDEVILGLPGTLPVMNKKAVEYSIKVGLALGCQIAQHTKWDRKSYYYPDLPKNYQISQYDQPLCAEGYFDLQLTDTETKRIRIRRAHLEEDAGKLLHEAPGGFAIDHSIVDLNRAGTPLLEIVTEPDLTTGAEVAAFGQELQRLVQYLGVSEAQMQMGHMRFEPNINVHITDENGVVHKTAIAEIKNLNSFSVLQRATDYEIGRQMNHWMETGDLGRKSTMGWDERTETTFLQRDKEEAHDYRYFPDPDLMPVVVNDIWLTELKAQMPELPAERRKRYAALVGLSEKDITLLMAERACGDVFDAIVIADIEPKRACTLVEVIREVEGAIGLEPAKVAAVAVLARENKIAASKETAKAILSRMLETGEAAETSASALGLIQSSDTGAIDAAIDAAVAANAKSVADYKAGKQAALGAIVGAVMKSQKGLNAKLVQQRLKEKLS